jgi:hypothetical protein
MEADHVVGLGRLPLAAGLAGTSFRRLGAKSADQTVAVGDQLGYCGYPGARQNASARRRPHWLLNSLLLALSAGRLAGRAEYGGMADHPQRWSARFTQVEMRRLWTYSDGALTAKGYRLPGGTARAGSWVLVDQATGNVQGVVPPGQFSRRFRPVDLFADVPGLPTYLGTVTASDGTALVDLVLDRNPFMLANGPRRVPRPHALIVPRSHRDGWSSATASELAACHTAMALVAAWYRSMDGGHVVFCANDSAPNLDYLRDVEAAGGTRAGGGTDVAVTKNPRQEVQHAHLHAFYTERDETENHESSALEGYPVIGAGYRAFSAALGSDAVKVEPDSTRLAADVSAAAQPWGGSYCSYQLGVDGPY